MCTEHKKNGSQDGDYLWWARQMDRIGRVDEVRCLSSHVRFMGIYGISYNALF